jgi:hypothetical protein
MYVQVPSSLSGALDGRVTYVIGKDSKCKKVYGESIFSLLRACLRM